MFPTFSYNRRSPYSPTNFSSKLFRSITLKKELVIFAQISGHTTTTQRTNSKAYHSPRSCVFLHFPLIVFVSHHFYSPPLLYGESCSTEQDKTESNLNYMIFTSISMYVGLHNFHLIDAYIVSRNEFQLRGWSTYQRNLSGHFGKPIDRNCELRNYWYNVSSSEINDRLWVVLKLMMETGFKQNMNG